MVEDVWQQKGMPKTINKEVAGHYAKVFTQAAQQGYGKNFIGIDYDTPDGKMIEHLQNNIYQFSAAKNWQQLKSLTQALINDDGKLRTKKEFFDEAYKINDEHVKTWLDAERNLALASGQMASKWQDLVGDDEDALLEFDAIIDDRTTEICAPLNDIVKPASDPFWSIYYPPNHFNCRSTARSVNGNRNVTKDKDIPSVDIPSMFQTNLAKDGLIFPKGHPYFTGTPHNALMSFEDANYSIDEKRGNGDGTVYISGAAYNEAKLMDADYYKEYQTRISVADAIADEFDKEVFMCPDFEAPQKDWRYPYFFKDVQKYKQPDFFINNEYWELESYVNEFKFSKISKMLKRGLKQGDNVILKINHSEDMKNITKAIKGYLEKSGSKAKGVIVVDDKNKVHVIK